jgi:flagellar basal body-associated protein FliL
MAEQTNQQPDVPPKKRKKLPLILAAVGGLAVVQGAVLFFVFKGAGAGPAPAHGSEGNHEIDTSGAAPPPGKAMAEIPLVRSFKVPNVKSGRTYIYDLDISVLVPAEKKDEGERIAKERAAQIADAIAQVVRGADARMLAEDDFRMLRGQMLQGLAEVVGDEDLFARVLIPRCVPIRAE